MVFPIGRSDGYPTDGGTSVLLSEILDSLFQAFVRNVGWMLPNLETSEEFELKYIEGVDSIRFLLLIELHWKKKKCSQLKLLQKQNNFLYTYSILEVKCV